MAARAWLDPPRKNLVHSSSSLNCDSADALDGHPPRRVDKSANIDSTVSDVGRFTHRNVTVCWPYSWKEDIDLGLQIRYGW